MITRQALNDSSKTNVWTLDIKTAKTLVKKIKATKGSWEYLNIVTPIRLAIKSQKTEVNVYTEGLATGQFATKLANTVGYIY